MRDPFCILHLRRVLPGPGEQLPAPRCAGNSRTGSTSVPKMHHAAYKTLGKRPVAKARRWELARGEFSRCHQRRVLCPRSQQVAGARGAAPVRSGLGRSLPRFQGDLKKQQRGLCRQLQMLQRRAAPCGAAVPAAAAGTGGGLHPACLQPRPADQRNSS